MRDVAAELAALGEREPALLLWKHALAFSNPPEGLELSLLSDMQAARLDAEAAAHIEALITDPRTHASRRLRLRQLPAWLKAAREAPGSGSLPEQRGLTAGGAR